MNTKKKAHILYGVLILSILLGVALFDFLSIIKAIEPYRGEKIVVILIYLPCLLIFLYCWGSIQIRSRASKAAAACLLALLASGAICLVPLIPGIGAILLFLLLGGLIASGIGCAAYGVSERNEILIPYGILCLIPGYCGVNFFILGAASGSGGGNVTTAIWSMILLPLFCAFMILDMVMVHKRLLPKCAEQTDIR